VAENAALGIIELSMIYHHTSPSFCSRWVEYANTLSVGSDDEVCPLMEDLGQGMVVTLPISICLSVRIYTCTFQHQRCVSCS